MIVLSVFNEVCKEYLLSRGQGLKLEMLINEKLAGRTPDVTNVTPSIADAYYAYFEQARYREEALAKMGTGGGDMEAAGYLTNDCEEAISG